MAMSEADNVVDRAERLVEELGEETVELHARAYLRGWFRLDYLILAGLALLFAGYAAAFFVGNTAEFVMDAVNADILVVKPADFDSRVPLVGRGVQILSVPILPG